MTYYAPELGLLKFSSTDINQWIRDSEAAIGAIDQILEGEAEPLYDNIELVEEGAQDFMTKGQGGGIGPRY